MVRNADLGKWALIENCAANEPFSDQHGAGSTEQGVGFHASLLRAPCSLLSPGRFNICAVIIRSRRQIRLGDLYDLCVSILFFGNAEIAENAEGFGMTYGAKGTGHGAGSTEYRVRSTELVAAAECFCLTLDSRRSTFRTSAGIARP